MNRINNMELVKETETKPRYMALYGSLRQGMYNFESFKRRYNEGIEVVKTGISLPGYQLFSLGAYPFCVESSEEDTVIVDLIKVTDSDASNGIDRMEWGAGYHSKEIEVDGQEATIYLYPPHRDYATHYTRVEDGDWVKYKSKTNNG